VDVSKSFDLHADDLMQRHRLSPYIGARFAALSSGPSGAARLFSTKEDYREKSRRTYCGRQKDGMQHLGKTAVRTTPIISCKTPTRSFARPSRMRKATAIVHRPRWWRKFTQYRRVRSRRALDPSPYSDSFTYSTAT
jgi:hypothetical protein